MNNSLISKVFAAVLLGIALLPASPLHAEETPSNSADTYELLNLFGDVLERIRADYVDAPSDKELIETAITGMLSALDPHSSYMNAESFGDMQVQTRGEFGGLGIEVTMENGFVKVVTLSTIRLLIARDCSPAILSRTLMVKPYWASP